MHGGGARKGDKRAREGAHEAEGAAAVYQGDVVGVQDLGEGAGGGEVGGGGARGGTAAGEKGVRRGFGGQGGGAAYKTQITGLGVEGGLMGEGKVVVGEGEGGEEAMVGREWEGDVRE